MISTSSRGDRMNSKTFITEMGAAKRYSNSARSNYSRGRSGSEKSMLPILPNKNTIVQAEEVDQGKLDHTYELLVEDIRRLKAEINPIRQYFLQLKDHLLFQSRCAANSNVIMSEQVPDLSAAVGDDTFSSVIENFQEQSDLNTEQCVELRNKFSNYWIIRLSCEVEAAREEIKKMRKSVTNDQKENEKVRSEISSMRRSKEIEKIDEQRKKIQSLILETSKAEQRNQKLTKLVEILEKQVPELAPENQAAFDEIQELMQQLTDARQKYFKKCDELIATRDKQVKELQNLEKTRKKQPGSNQPPKIVEPAEKPNSPRGRKTFSQPIQTPVEETENTEENADHININVNDDEDEVMKQYLNSNDNDNDNNDNIDNDNNDENDNDNRNIEDNPPENYEENETGENANDDDQIEVDHTEVDHIEVDRTEVDHIEVDQIENGNENRENITNEVDNDENTPEQEGDIVETTRVSFDLLNVQPNESELSMIPTDDENEVHDSDDIHVDDS